MEEGVTGVHERRGALGRVELPPHPPQVLCLWRGHVHDLWNERRRACEQIPPAGVLDASSVLCSAALLLTRCNAPHQFPRGHSTRSSQCWVCQTQQHSVNVGLMKRPATRNSSLALSEFRVDAGVAWTKRGRLFQGSTSKRPTGDRIAPVRRGAVGLA